jgi:Flp pilus assembly pilin Flp
MTMLRNLIVETSAQDMAEYGIALAIIAVGAGLVAAAVATDVGQIWTNAQNVIHAAL